MNRDIGGPPSTQRRKSSKKTVMYAQAPGSSTLLIHQRKVGVLVEDL